MPSNKKAAKARRREEAMDVAEAPLKSALTSLSGPAAPSESMIATLLGAAQAHADTLDMDAAISVYQQVLKTSPLCVTALDGLGDACLQAGDTEQAISALTRSIELHPDGGHERYMNLGQLCEGASALSWLERGVALVRAQREAASDAAGPTSTAGPSEPQLEATRALATALCSIAEVFLTDACDEPEAEERCNAAATEAVELARSLPTQTLLEPFVTLASVRISQERPDEAKPLLLAALDIVANAEEDALPPFDARLSCAKLLMEVGEACGDGIDDEDGGGGSSGEGSTSLAAEALELMQSLRLERDEALEVWYLTCIAALQAGESSLALAEASAACEFAQSEVCPPEEREWLPQLLEVREDASAACECEAEPCDED